MQYKTLRRAAYVPAPDASLTAEFRTLAFPEHWRDELLALCNRNRPEGSRPLRTVPLHRMNQVLQTLAPDLIVRPRSDSSGTAGTEDFWLCAPTEVPDPLPGPVLDGLLTVWLGDLCPGDPAAVRGTLDLLRAEPPVWHSRKLALLRCPSSEGGTAVPLPYQYQLATDHLARRIQDLGAYDTGAGLLHFRAVPRGPREQGAELMSQPLPHEAGSRTWWFSVVINISLHTVPFSPLPRLHLHTGIRRWNTHVRRKDGRLALPFGRATSVYLLPRVPWLPGAPVSRRHAVAKLAWSREVGGIDWSASGPAGMLGRLTLTERFPDAESILTDPLHWFTREKGTRAAVVHSNHMGPHKVGHGLMSHQRSQITEWAEQALPDGLVAAPPLSISKRGPRGPLNPRPKPSATGKEDVERRTADVRREALAAALPTGTGPVPCLEARLLWQTRELREEAVAALKAVLGLKGDEGAEEVSQQAYEQATPRSPVLLTWESPELTVRLRCLPLANGLADDLPIDPTLRPKQRALGEALHSRRAAVAQWLRADGATSEDPGLALVEIDRREDFTTAAHDAKFALRLGCADAGVLTQFTHVAKLTEGDDTPGSLSHRTRSAWDDGLRQLGVRIVPEHALGDALPAGLQYVAVWMVKKRKDGRTGLPRYLPVAVKVTPREAGDGGCVITGWDRELRRWIPYPQFLLALTRHAEIPRNLDVPAPRSGDDAEAPAAETRNPWEWKQNADAQRADTARWLGHVRRSLRGTDSVLLAHAQNCRSLWPWMGNSRVVADLVQFSDEPAGRLDAGLRLVRVRGTQGRETPQWWGVNTPGKPNGLSVGLWCEPSGEPSSERVFYSTTEKPSQFATTAVSADKLKARPLLKGKRKGELTTDSRVVAWNPAMVEITVLGGDSAAGDEPEALALAVHQLRQAPDYGASLSNPLPLHLASKAQEYVLPTVGQDVGLGEGQVVSEENAVAAVPARGTYLPEK
ncbi:pPIWI_RE module domain-containing protein [Streptomyces sp. NPDC058726]|uniref:pPIWI_RE module domain-containing protein n=1 Tax=Streptomyces sp. NPDC058726 TaxID=3346611 RepID=UPI0036A4C4C9